MNRNLPFQYFIVFVLLVLFAPACRPTSGLNLFFSEGTRSDTNLTHVKKAFRVVYEGNGGTYSCSAFLIDLDLLMTAGHCRVQATARVTSGKRYLSEPSAKLPVPNGEIYGAPVAYDKDRDVAIHRVKWLFDAPDYSEVFTKIWTNAEDYPVKDVEINEGGSFSTEYHFINKVKAFTVGFPHDKNQRPSYSDGLIRKITMWNGSDGRRNPALETTVGWTSGNSGGFIQDSDTGKLLGVIATGGKMHEFHNAGNDTGEGYDAETAFILNRSFAMYDVFVNSPLAPTLQSLYDANGNHKKATGVKISVGDNGSSQPNFSVSDTKYTKVGFLPGKISTKIFLTVLDDVSMMTVCGGESIKCALPKNMANEQKSRGLFVVQLTKELSHEVRETVPLVLILDMKDGSKVQESYDMERVL